MRVLVSAYACAPNRGSEPEVGFQAVLAAASLHETWVLTRKKNVSLLRDHLLDIDPELAERVHVVGLDLGRRHLRGKRLFGAAGLYAYYEAWQRQARKVARDLDSAVDFDVVHHVTFATYWTRAGVAEIGKPSVWGPVGGGAGPPWRLLTVLGWRGACRDLTRLLTQRLLFAVVAPRPKGSILALAQNPETAAAIGGSAVAPSALAVAVRPPSGPASARRPNVLVVGRLVPYKAVVLAVRTMSHVKHPDARLIIFGDGPERSRVEATIRRRGLEGRVELRGDLSRDQLLVEVARAGVLLHPALHDDAPLAVAEALSLRTPVVCLDRAGPPVLRQWWPKSPAVVVPIGSPERTAVALAAAVDGFLGRPEAPAQEASLPVRTFREVLLESYVTISRRAALDGGTALTAPDRPAGVDS